MSGAWSLRTRLLLLVLGTLLAAQIASILLFVEERRRAVGFSVAQEAASRMATLSVVLGEVSPATQAEVLRAAGSRAASFAVAAAPLTDTPGARPLDRVSRWIGRAVEAPRGALRVALLAEQGAMALPRTDDRRPERGVADRSSRLRDWDAARDVLLMARRLDDGRWLNATVRLRRPPLQWAWPALLSLALTAVMLSAAVWWAVRGIARPIDALAGAASALGRGEHPEPLPLRGPAELRRVSAAFNDMAERLTRLLRERSQMLAAIGHDLRSPVTAMRLRLEMLDDAEARARIGASVEEIETLVEAALALARGGGADQPREPVDLAALLGEIAAGLRETGADVSLDAPEPVTVRAAPAALRRALRNVAENAVRYGDRARIRLRGADSTARIEIADDGPGIPSAERERVFEPFVRLEASRSRDTGGSGLGLAIARAAIDGHGGTIAFTAAGSGGACVVITLPRA